MDSFKNRQQKLSSAKPSLSMLSSSSKYGPIFPIKPVKVRKPGVQEPQIRPVSNTSRQTFGNYSVRNAQEDVSSLSSRDTAVTNEAKLYNSVCNALQPLKPTKIQAHELNELLEYEFAEYLREELLYSLLEEDDATVKDIIADEETVSDIRSLFEERELGITLAKNNILYVKLDNIEIFDCLLDRLSKIASILKADTSQVITSKLCESIDVLPIVNCTYSSAKYQVDWKALANTAERLQSMLCSEDKPFHLVNLMQNACQEVQQQIDQLDLNAHRKLSLQQIALFLISLRLSYLTVQMNEHRMSKEQSFIPAISEEDLSTAVNSDQLETSQF